jgi:sulfonate transport system substrate-binding protein
LAAILGGSPLVFAQFAVVEPRTTAIIVKDNSGINGVPDLVGKSVAVNRSRVAEFLLVAALQKFHVDRSKVKVVHLNPPEAAPAFGLGQVDAWAMWSPGVDIARSQYKGHDIFVEGRDLIFQIDFNSWLVRKEFCDRNRDLVAAVNAAFAAEAEWASTQTVEAETIAQRQGHYAGQIRDTFITQKTGGVVPQSAGAEWLNYAASCGNFDCWRRDDDRFAIRPLTVAGTRPEEGDAVRSGPRLRIGGRFSGDWVTGERK